ncbi:hypothetical protein GIB67_016011 [Kingdonia uniflora]|uniref:EF hand associated type-2 domain-containing protein n=1 Tax=Kingdonia uniflora TaxID=39325 RepID=A0A7J7L1Q8_9MAGN|nr:hypothetical protein GIB67_016011 [Kingdonia uniflora]
MYSSNLVANALDVIGGTIENRLIPGDKLFFGMSQFFVEAQLPGARLIFSTRFVDNIFADIVVEPRGLEVELFRKGGFGRVGVQNDRPMVRSYDREVTDGSVQKSGAPGDGPDGSVKALLDQLTSSSLIRPSKRDTGVSQFYHGGVKDEVIQGVRRCVVERNSAKLFFFAGNTVQIPHNNPGNADRARAACQWRPSKRFCLRGLRLDERINAVQRRGEDGKVNIAAPGQPEAIGMMRASSHSVSVSEAKNTEFAERVRVENLSFEDDVGVEFLVMSEEFSKGGLLCSPPAVPGENNHCSAVTLGLITGNSLMLQPAAVLVKSSRWRSFSKKFPLSADVFLWVQPMLRYVSFAAPGSPEKRKSYEVAEFKCVRDDAANGAEALEALVLDRDSGFAIVVRPVNRNCLNKRRILVISLLHSFLMPSRINESFKVGEMEQNATANFHFSCRLSHCDLSNLKLGVGSCVEHLLNMSASSLSFRLNIFWDPQRQSTHSSSLINYLHWRVLSVDLIFQVRNIFFHAWRVAAAPAAPLFDKETQYLRARCVRAFKHIFILCDRDRDGLLSDAELCNLELKCWGETTTHADLLDYKRLAQEEPKGGVTLAGFLSLQSNLVKLGSTSNLWGALYHFGFDSDLKLRDDLLPVLSKGDSDQVLRLHPEYTELLFSTEPAFKSLILCFKYLFLNTFARGSGRVFEVSLQLIRP